MFLLSLVGLRNHEGDFLSEEYVDAAYDYAFALIGGGLPSSFHLAHALARRDYDDALYYAKVEAAVLATQYSMLKILNWYQGPKYAMTFHRLHQGLGVARGIIARTLGVYTAPVWAAVVSAKTGSKLAQIHPGQDMQSVTSLHYASGGDVGSGGSMPVIAGDGSHPSDILPTWDDVVELFTWE